MTAFEPGTEMRLEFRECDHVCALLGVRSRPPRFRRRRS